LYETGKYLVLQCKVPVVVVVVGLGWMQAKEGEGRARHKDGVKRESAGTSMHAAFPYLLDTSRVPA